MAKESLEERLRRIEAEAARKRKEAAAAAEKSGSNAPTEQKETKAESKAESAQPAVKKETVGDKPEKKNNEPTEKKQAPSRPVKPEDAPPTEKKADEKPKPRRQPMSNTSKPKADAAPEAKTETKPEPKADKPAENKTENAEAKDDKPAAKKPTRRRAPRKKTSKPAENKTDGNTTEDSPQAESKSDADAPEKPKRTNSRSKSSRSNSDDTAKQENKSAAAPAAKDKQDSNKADETKKPAPKRKSRAKSSRAKKTDDAKTDSRKSTAKSSTSRSSSSNTTKAKPTTKKAPAKRKAAPRKSAAKQPDSDKELIINSTPTQVEIALMENGKLVELHHQKTNNNFTVGDIFLGRIKRLMPGLNAAFVDIGHKKDAFLHYTDLGPKLRSLHKYTAEAISGKSNTHKLDDFKLEKEIIKTGKVDHVFNKRDTILVQVLKEPIGTKGPRLSCEITIPGRFLVLTPFVDVIAVSKKIGNSEERKRLKMLIESIKPKNFGVIVRTAAEGKKVQDLHEELNLMMGKWESIYSQLKGAQPPMKLLSELDKTSSILRDILNDSFNNIVVNDKEMYNNIRTYMGSFAPDQVNIINMHNSRKPIFDVHNITKQIKSGFGKTATMPSGSYLVIEHTEAMHVIDVNSGHKMSSADQESAVLSVNMESAEEIARQLRLRDIGGIIIVDFIDMRNKDNKAKLVTAMRQHMKKDRAQHTILPLSKFGLMQITRQRVRPEVKINTAEVCPSCKGSGKINPSILLTDDLERDLKFILQSRPKSKIVLTVHPYIEAFLKKGIPSIQMKWYMKFYKWIKIRSNNDYSMTAYKFHDQNDDEIRLK